MQIKAYDGYFDDGKFYSSGKVLRLPEGRRIVITVLDEYQSIYLDDEKKREILRSLRGSGNDPSMIEPSEIPLEHDLVRRYDFI